MSHTLYARVVYIAADGRRYEVGDTVEFPDGDTEHMGLLRTGVLVPVPPRREAGSNSARTEPAQ